MQEDSLALRVTFLAIIAGVHSRGCVEGKVQLRYFFPLSWVSKRRQRHPAHALVADLGLVPYLYYCTVGPLRAWRARTIQ